MTQTTQITPTVIVTPPPTPITPSTPKAAPPAAEKPHPNAGPKAHPNLGKGKPWANHKGPVTNWERVRRLKYYVC